jgi:hypothetical protein
VIARLRESEAPAMAGFVLGNEKREARLERALVPALGIIFFATAVFAGGRMDELFDAGVGRIGRRD